MNEINGTTMDTPFPANYDRDTNIWYVELHPYLLLVGGSLFIFWFAFAGIAIPLFRLYTHLRLKYYPNPEDADRLAAGTTRYIHSKHWGLTTFCYVTAISCILALYISAAFEYDNEWVSPSQFFNFIWYICHYWTWHPALRPTMSVFIFLYFFAFIDILIPSLAGIVTIGQWTDENLQSTANNPITDAERQHLTIGEAHEFNESGARASNTSLDSPHSVKFSGSIDSATELVPIEDELVHGFIVVCHNSSKDIIHTIRPILQHIEPWQLFLADNGSTQLECVKTQKVCDEATAEFKEAHPDYDGPPINLSHLNKGNKTWAQYALVKEMSDFRIDAVQSGGELSSLAINCVTLLDDDVIWPSTWASHKCDKIFKDKATVAIAYPLYAENGSDTVWTRFQEHEYLMGDAGVNRFLQDTMGTNLFCSGAAATWRLEVLMEVLLRHDTTFNGEDLEMGYITHRLSGRDNKLLANVAYLPTFEEDKPNKEGAVIRNDRSQQMMENIDRYSSATEDLNYGEDSMGYAVSSDSSGRNSRASVDSGGNLHSCISNMSAVGADTQLTEAEYKRRRQHVRTINRAAKRGHKIAVMRDCFVPTIVPFCFIHYWDFMPNPTARKYFPNRKCSRDCGEASLVAQRFRSWEVGNHSFTWRFVKLLISPGGLTSRAKWVARLITFWRLISIAREYLYIGVILYTAIWIPSWFGSMMILTIDMTIIYLGFLYTAQMYLNYACLRKPHMQTRTETAIAFPWIFSLPYLILIRPLFIAYFICYYFSFVRWPTEIRKAVVHDAKLNKEIGQTWNLSRSMSDFVRTPGGSPYGDQSANTSSQLRSTISHESIFAPNNSVYGRQSSGHRDSMFDPSGGYRSSSSSGSNWDHMEGVSPPISRPTSNFYNKHFRGFRGSQMSDSTSNNSMQHSAIVFNESISEDGEDGSYSDAEVSSGGRISPDRILTHAAAHHDTLNQMARYGDPRASPSNGVNNNGCYKVCSI
ncbi:hypothetical protein SARC_10220 [Sphaeroforma arctica JP610]|uniref:Uncharacterized protein n=1 Tax=Sphaeroforma arctica JP610 TaxID=667725 RepID=A0A0L0FKL0_9EUKA|nr:hypothetical protein SARC_10220 [Sphaeroforma arctica JP610]KNC77319.1 hypothetical protein SARC_10220 [Sphaeroforma arctica JP610]|eukprot:XP_014151221.1 hypothetical protein SARC_10220 [Sphaeroforma arctica JP610]